MPGNGAIGDLRWPLADQRLRGDMGPRLLPGSRPRDPQRLAPAQAGDQLPFERTAAFYVERLVDGLVADPHGLFIGEIDLQPLGDLLRAPCRYPSPITPVGFVRLCHRTAAGPTTTRPSGPRTTPASLSWTY
jgi:hypothetical protein